tara:strand:- start:1384 stop:2358 length:975 start_codon:yes stop_codon:yes gene_type:complete
MSTKEDLPGDFSKREIMSALADAVGGQRLLVDQSLAPYTTLRVGGAADFFVEVSDDEKILALLQVAHDLKIPVTMLGGGSNVLVGDRGIRGLVVRVRHGRIFRAGIDAVRASAGVTLNGLVRWMVRRGISGIERWAGTPGTVGGAIVGNAHFGGRLLSETISSVGLVAKGCRQETVPVADMRFEYDVSRIQMTDEVVLWAEFRTGEASQAELLEATRRSLQYRKSTQPLGKPSAGCVFRNPSINDSELASKIPCSAGALIDRAGLKGSVEGAVVVSERHANFFVTRPQATAMDVKVLMERCQQTVRQKFDVDLVPEIVLLGEFE